MTLFTAKAPMEGAPLPRGFARWCRAIDRALCSMAVVGGHISWSAGVPTIILDAGVGKTGYPWGKIYTFGLIDKGPHLVGGVPETPARRDLQIYKGACRRGGGPATVRPLGPGTDSDVWTALYNPTTVTFPADDGSGQWVVGKWTETGGFEILSTPQVNAPSPRDGVGGEYFPIALISFSKGGFHLLHYAVGGVKDLTIFGPETA